MSAKCTPADCPVAPRAKYSTGLMDSFPGNEWRAQQKGVILHSALVFTEFFLYCVFYIAETEQEFIFIIINTGCF